MSAAAAEPAPKHGFIVHHKRLIVGAIVVIVIGAAAQVFGWDLRSWFDNLWDTLTGISFTYIVAGCALKTVQTTLTAYSWYSILRFGYRDRAPRLLDVVACYAASVALNGFLPANLGTFALLIMFTTLIAGATFAGILAAYGVQKIFFTLIGFFVYLYLFLSVGGSFDIKFGFIHDHPWSFVIMILGCVFLVYLLVRRWWPKVLEWWDQAKEGGAILTKPRTYMARVFLPSFLAWCASLAVIGVFLAAYGIPVTFHTIMSVVGGNSIANVTSVTPGGAGVTQAFNVASLASVTDSATAAAYSVGQQLITTAWNIIFGIVMLLLAFGATRSRELVTSSYDEAKVKAAEQKTAHDARKEAKHEERSREKAARRSSRRHRNA